MPPTPVIPESCAGLCVGFVRRLCQGTITHTDSAAGAILKTQLNRLHTFGLDARCQDLICLREDSELSALPNLAASQPYWILGQGSNTVFVDDYQGTVLHIRTKGISHADSPDHHLLRVAAGENWHQLVCYCLDRGMPGFENLALIPGTVGAAPIQNIGAYGVELAEYVDYVEYYDLIGRGTHRLSQAECQFGYRHSIFKTAIARHWLVTYVGFKLPKAWQANISYGSLQSLQAPSPQQVFTAVVHIRRQKLPDPASLGNAGSFFKNPVINADHFANLASQFNQVPHYVQSQGVKIPAAWLIEQCGFKGRIHQGIGCHPTQALVLTNAKQGTGPALLNFAKEIVVRVQERFDITLENEVRLLGRHGLVNL